MNKIDKKLLFAAWSCHDKFYALNQWLGPIENVFRETLSFDPKEILYKHGQEEMNSRFLRLVEKEKPDYILFWIIYDEFYLNTFEKIREMSPKTMLLNFFGDDDVAFRNSSRFYSLFFDYCLIFQKNYLDLYKKEGIKDIYPFFGANVDVFKNKKYAKEFDVSFIGTPKANRYSAIKYLISKGINLKIAGAGWEKYPDLKDFCIGKLSTEESVDLINKSRISLSFTRNHLGNLHFNSRLFEIMACKSFALGEHFNGYEELYSKKELDMFRDEKELVKKVKYYLGNEKEREKMAERAYRKTINNFSYENQLKKIFSSILKNDKKNKPLPRLNVNVKYLRLNDLNKTPQHIIDISRNFDYISFHDKTNIISRYKEYLQVYSLLKSNKNISCCDYYLYNKNIGDYLCFASFSSYVDSSHYFHKLVSPYQLVIKKDYFINNLDKFKDYLLKREGALINKTNTEIVSLPLIKITNNENPFIGNISQYLLKFENELRCTYNTNKHLMLKYIYKLILYSGRHRSLILNQIIRRSLASLNNSHQTKIVSSLLRNI